GRPPSSGGLKSFGNATPPSRSFASFARRSAMSRFSPSLSAIPLSLQALLEAFLEEVVEVAVEHVLRPPALEIRAQILHARLVEHVGADLAAPADVRLAVLDDLRLLLALLLLELVELRAHLVHRGRAVLVLRALVLTLHDDPGRDVRDPDRRLRLVDVLAARAARAEHVDAQVGGIQLDLDVVLDPGGNDHRRARRVAAVTRR